MNADELLVRTLRLLQGAIRVSGHSQTEIDEAIGRRRGYLSHVFQRRVDLKVRDLLRALTALDIDVRRFFEAVAAGKSEAQPTLDELLRLATGSLREGRRGAPAAGSRDLDDPELMAKIREGVLQVLASLRERRG